MLHFGNKFFLSRKIIGLLLDFIYFFLVLIYIFLMLLVLLVMFIIVVVCFVFLGSSLFLLLSLDFF